MSALIGFITFWVWLTQLCNLIGRTSKIDAIIAREKKAKMFNKYEVAALMDYNEIEIEEAPIAAVITH